jgi:hypothetical protein
LPDFSWFNIPEWKKIPNNHKIYQTTIQYIQWQYNRPNGHKICQHLPLLDHPKLTQIGIFGLKICHLATLGRSRLYPFSGIQLKFSTKLVFSTTEFDLQEPTSIFRELEKSNSWEPLHTFFWVEPKY